MSAPGGSAAPVDLGDPLAVLGYGEDALDDGLEPRMADALDPADATALVQRLDELHRAMQAGDPRRLTRGTGLLGRLLGKDVVAEAEADALRARIGVLVAGAERSAAALAARAALQQALREEAVAAVARIDTAIARARRWLQTPSGSGGAPDGAADATARARLERRLHQLASVRDARDIGARQLALLRDQNLDLVARYRRIHDVLLPAWRQHALAGAAKAGAGRAAAAADASAAIASEVAAMAGKLD